MDIFNNRKVAELERKLLDTEIERNNYKFQTECLIRKLEEVTALNESTPENCTKGPWCKACEFVRTFHYFDYLNPLRHKTDIVYVCGKGNSCVNFVQKELENEE